MLHERVKEPYSSSLGRTAQKDKQSKNLENEGIRNITLKSHNASQESNVGTKQIENQSNAAVTKNITKLKEQYVSSWGKTKLENKTEQEK